MSANISVIICTYNSVYENLLLTLSSVIMQEQTELEIIITDDGTDPVYKDDLSAYIAEHSVKNIRLLYNSENKGTIGNIYTALQYCTGKYCYIISPGDFLYDTLVLRDLYDFAEKNKAPIVFGNELTYSCNEGKLKVHEDICFPSKPSLYAAERSIDERKTAICCGNFAAGPTYFRETELTKKYLKLLLGMIKYTEDNTISLLAAADNIPMTYYDRNMVWYEYGTGISTSNDDKWENIIQNELKSVYKYVYDEYHDRLFRTSAELLWSDSMLQRIKCFIRHPGFYLKVKGIGSQPECRRNITPDDISGLEHLLKKHLGGHINAGN